MPILSTSLNKLPFDPQQDNNHDYKQKEFTEPEENIVAQSIVIIDFDGTANISIHWNS